VTDLRKQIEEGKKIAADHAASLLPPGVRLDWGPLSGEIYSLVARDALGPYTLVRFREDALVDLPQSRAAPSGRDEHWTRVRAFTRLRVEGWKAKRLRPPAAPSGKRAGS
jgi:hypothetical protein